MLPLEVMPLEPVEVLPLLPPDELEEELLEDELELDDELEEELLLPPVEVLTPPGC